MLPLPVTVECGISWQYTGPSQSSFQQVNASKIVLSLSEVGYLPLRRYGSLYCHGL